MERRAASLAFLSTVQDGEAARSPEAPSAGQTEVWSCWLEVEGRVLALPDPILEDPSKILLVRRGEGQGRSTSDDAAAAARSAAAAGGAGARGRDRPTAAPASSCKAVGAAGSKDSKDVDSAAHFLQKVNLSSPRATPPPRPAASPEEAPKANHGSAAAQPPDASTATPAAPPAPAGAPGAVHPVAQAATAATAAAMLSGSECCVCMESRKSHIFVPCGHVCVCGGCADNIMAASKECPICRQVSSLCMKVFMCD